MHLHTDNRTVNQAFFQPLQPILSTAANLWYCPELPDDEWVRMGVQRVLEASQSGRAFLQEHGLRFEQTPTHTNYFAALRSERRGELVREVNQSLIAALEPRLRDRLADLPELARYACFAADGHWHKAAAHDARQAGTQMAVGHFYSLNLRTHTLRHLVAGQGLHEHDMSALKRITPRGLRQGIRSGTRVLMIYDKAGIGSDYWQRCRRECAVYFLSRAKENLVLTLEALRPWERADARNQGVLDDRFVRTVDGHRLRVVRYWDALGDQEYEFLTNEMDLPPGILAELYRRRWEIEKVFAEVKNKLGQMKAWGSSLTAKEAQAQMIALTHNLLIGYEADLAERHAATNTAEDRRRSQRDERVRQACETQGWAVSSLVLAAQGATQRSVKFIRWLRQALRDRLAEDGAVPRLRALYAVL